MVRGAILGAFAGLLSGKFALGLIFGFIAGIAIDASKRRPPASGDSQPPDADGAA